MVIRERDLLTHSYIFLFSGVYIRFKTIFHQSQEVCRVNAADLFSWCVAPLKGLAEDGYDSALLLEMCLSAEELTQMD